MEHRPCKSLIASERASQTGKTLHFIASFDEKRGLCGFVCETQPMTTIWTTNDKPLARCPGCGAQNPLRGEADGIQPK